MERFIEPHGGCSVDYNLHLGGQKPSILLVDTQIGIEAVACDGPNPLKGLWLGLEQQFKNLFPTSRFSYSFGFPISSLTASFDQVIILS